MEITKTHMEYELFMEVLKNFLNRDDIIGYVAGRNLAKINDELKDYFQRKNKIISKFGTETTDENGNTFKSIKPNSKEFEQFFKEFGPFMQKELTINLLTLSENDVKNSKLTGNDIVKLSWIIE